MTDPYVVNHLNVFKNNDFDFYPAYPEKRIEVERISKNKINFKEFNLDEIQSLDPYKVAKQKAYDAWKNNQYNPILIEDTSLYVFAMNGFPGTLAASFTNTVDQRHLICEVVERKKDKRVIAQAIIAIYDGQIFHTWESKENGLIPPEPRGAKGFGWDDIFIPVVEGKSSDKTFAEMTDEEKDRLSMRGKVWRKLINSTFKYYPPAYSLPEPYEEELMRIRHNEISRKARHFSYRLEAVEKRNSITHLLKANEYMPIIKEETLFYKRYSQFPKSPSIGILLTNIDMDRIEKNSDNEPKLWQMGPKRRTLALAQRALFFDHNQNKKIHALLDKYESGSIIVPSRSNKRLSVVEKALGIKKDNTHALYTPAISEIGYKKISSNKKLSRREVISYGLFNKIGKYPRKIIGLGSMPPTTGWRDTLVTAAIGHMIAFIPRNSVFAGNVKRRIQLGLEVKSVIDSLSIPDKWKERAKGNIGASLGLDDPREEIKIAKLLFKKAGIKLFRIYTIGSDKRVINIAKAIRSEFGNSVELFVGQIADKRHAEALIHPQIRVDGLIYGHGGGQQCTSAINGMAITTLEDIYEIGLDPAFNLTTLLVEGGIDRSIGTALILGVDCCLGNQKLVHGTIETGDLFVQTNRGRIGQPYAGSASPVTQIIESENPQIRARRTDASGRTYSAEGKPGFMYFEKKANSMTFWINEHQAYAARTLVDLGVKNIPQLRKLLQQNHREFLRIMSEKTQYISDAFGNYTY